MDYHEFLKEKEIADQPNGFDVPISKINPKLFDWQKALVRWCLIRGRSALFASTGLGKTPMQLVWADTVSKKTKGPVLVLAPLAVSEQTQQEGKKFDIDSSVCSSQSDIRQGINITNYEKLHKFDTSRFPGVVWDESSILKSFGSIRNQVVEAFRNTPYRLSCTATPSPNDWAELGHQSEALGILTYREMLSTFFINDSGDTGKWRLKGHVQDNVFWRWLASWAAVVAMPSNLGFPDDGFRLPPITYHEHIIPATGKLKRRGFFIQEVSDMTDRRRVRRDTLSVRCQAAADLINSTNDIWAVWCNLNPEGEALTKLIDGAVEVAGRHDNETKAQRMLDFANGKIKRIVTKPEIAGWGMNWQVCSKAAFVGLNDSWESLFQAIRRIWRYGQTKPVDIHIFIEEREGPVLANIKRKDAQASEMALAMADQMKDLTKREVLKASKEFDSYCPKKAMEIPVWMKTN